MWNTCNSRLLLFSPFLGKVVEIISENTQEHWMNKRLWHCSRPTREKVLFFLWALLQKACYLEFWLWINTKAQPTSQSSTGTTSLAVIPFDAAYAACRVCVRDAANLVPIITVSKGNPWKWRHPAAEGHTLEGDTYIHTLLPHLQSELHEYAPLATALFHIKPWKVSKSHKGQRTESRATWKRRRKEDHGSESYSLCDMQDWKCRCLVSHAEHQQSSSLWSARNSGHVRMDSAFFSFRFSHFSARMWCSTVFKPFGAFRQWHHAEKNHGPFTVRSADVAKALGKGASLPQFCVCENWGMRYWRCLFLAEISCVLRNSEAWRAICLESRINFQSHQPVRDVLEERTVRQIGVSEQGWPNLALVLKTAKLYTTAGLYS